jgi:chitinase
MGSPTNEVVGARWVIGYYAAYQRDAYPPSEIDWSGVSHLVLTRLKTDGGGKVQRDLDVDAVNGPLLAKDIAQRAHQNGRKVLLLVGGAGQGTGLRDSASNGNRATFVTNLLQAMNDLGFDGLDLDWEESVDYELWTALARDLRASKLAPPGLILTGDVFPVNGNYQMVEPKVTALAEQLDRLNVMSYFPGTAFAGEGWRSWHGSALTGSKGTTPIAIDDTLARYAKAGVPKGKLTMGVAFYAMCYTGGVTAPDQDTANGVSILGGDNDFPLQVLFASNGSFSAANRKWDATAQVPYLTLPSPESHGCRYVSFDDEESLEAKGAFARANAYGGIIVWTLNQGWLTGSTKPKNALMQALKRGFLDP